MKARYGVEGSSRQLRLPILGDNVPRMAGVKTDCLSVIRYLATTRPDGLDRLLGLPRRPAGGRTDVDVRAARKAECFRLK